MLIRRKLPLFAILIVMFSLLIISIFNSIYLSYILTNITKNNMHQVLEMESIYLESFFKSRTIEVDYLSKNGLVQSTLLSYLQDSKDNPSFKKTYTDLNNQLLKMEQNSDELSQIFVLSPKGIVLAGNNPNSYGIDLSDRQYFIDAMQGKSTISNLLVDRVNNESVLFVATPINDPTTNRIIGVMGNIVDPKNASESLRSLVKPDIGDAYLIDKGGQIIFHTDRSLIGTRHISSEVDQYFRQENLGSTEVQDFSYSNGRYFVISQSITGTPWRLVIEQNISNIKKSSDDAIRVMLIIAIITLFTTALISYFYSKTITEPITKLSRIISKTALGDLNVHSDYNQKNELGTLSESYNLMLDKLTIAYRDIEYKNEELTATEEELRIFSTHLLQNQEELMSVQEKYIQALKGSSDIIWEWEYSTHLFFASEVWSSLTERDSYKEFIDKVAFEELVDEHQQQIIYEYFQEHWTNKTDSLEFTFPYVSPTGSKRYFLVKATTLWNEHIAIKSSGKLTDITFEVDAKEKIHDLAFLNQLSKLPNQLSYMTDIKQLIEKSSHTVKPFAVIQLDIDNFMRINNSLGHKIGNELLLTVSKRLSSLCSSQIRVYHLYEDEFSLIVNETALESDIQLIINKIYDLLNQPFILNNKSIYLGVSMGISIYPNDGDTSEKLMQNADTAVFTVKQKGKNDFLFYTKIMSELVQRKIETEAVLRRAIDSGLISLHYQPQIEVSTKKIKAFEALMRITTERGELISPSEFIPVAEETGLIIPLGEWALKEAAMTCRNLLDLGYDFTHISVNVSGIQLNQAGFSEHVVSIIHSVGIPFHFIELEVTESILFNFIKEHEDELTKLSHLGFKIALDDFGTGYSSFSYIRTMPLTSLKIDKSFIDDITTSQKDKDLVRQMIDMAHELNLDVIAEGVETKDQVTILESKMCDYIQGYYFSKPLPYEKLIELLDKDKP